ncbi:hypothetical protein SAMN05216567_105174 [Variovorax sp. OK605]|uniref:hypothetical protein n=1 Tax=Variovorax sp. OK605 TaxID=1855317 RepID=UPI0008F31981|nr:hypothetical protein [Variovorax sp. OK605]SFP28167.1 hypothetical protein SAMN05216567_105174 [Variovorax sp. OK605]
MTDLTPQQEWKLKTTSYAEAVNRYVETGLRDGWNTAGEEPQMLKTAHLLAPLLAALKAHNAAAPDEAARAAFREDWPPAHEPLIPRLQQHGQSIPTVALLDDGSILARIGAAHEAGHVVRLAGDKVERVEGIEFFGRCPARRFFAVAQADGVRITDGWQGPTTALCLWPTGLEDLPALPDSVASPRFAAPPKPTQLVPFPDGQRVLLVSASGTFVLSAQGARRLMPRMEELAEQLAEEDFDPEYFGLDLSMEHGAVSPDGQWIAVGGQDGRHLVFDAALKLQAQIGPVGEYPHFALFNQRSDRLVLNACHFYNGATLGVQMKDVPGLDTEYYAKDPRTPTLEDGARVYAGVHRGDEFIVGDAHGYLRAFGEDGQARWQHFIGSTVGALDLSADGQTLVATTCAGFVCVIALDAGRQVPGQIGTGGHFEQRRWLLWKNSKGPLLW